MGIFDSFENQRIKSSPCMGLYERMWTFHNEQKIFLKFYITMFLNTNDPVWKCFAIFFHFKTVTIFLKPYDDYKNNLFIMYLQKRV